MAHLQSVEDRKSMCECIGMRHAIYRSQIAFSICALLLGIVVTFWLFPKFFQERVILLREMLTVLFACSAWFWCLGYVFSIIFEGTRASYRHAYSEISVNRAIFRFGEEIQDVVAICQMLLIAALAVYVWRGVTNEILVLLISNRH